MIIKRIKRSARIVFKAIFGVHSPTLKRRVRISDIWDTPYYWG